MLPAKVNGGFFRFLCPLCSGFETATNPKTNLARCFSCERNFNTIDMMMICRKMNFVESVKYLKTYHENFTKNEKFSSGFSNATANGLTRLSKVLSQMDNRH
jgi:reverse gyrase